MRSPTRGHFTRVHPLLHPPIQSHAHTNTHTDTNSAFPLLDPLAVVALSRTSRGRDRRSKSYRDRSPTLCGTTFPNAWDPYGEKSTDERVTMRNFRQVSLEFLSLSLHRSNLTPVGTTRFGDSSVS